MYVYTCRSLELIHSGRIASLFDRMEKDTNLM